MTALAGMAMLMEGSTLREGKYSDNLVKAVELVHAAGRSPTACSATRTTRPRQPRYMYGHGFGLLFLASVYGEEEDNDRRKKLEKHPEEGGRVHRQGPDRHSGGWGYVSAAGRRQLRRGLGDHHQLQALRAAQNAGIPVPKEIIDKAVEYLGSARPPRGGVIYNLRRQRGGAAARSGRR